MINNIIFGIVGQLLFLVILIMLVVRGKISGKKTAVAGFVLLFVTMLCSLFKQDTAAGDIAEYVWILFTVSLVQQFIHFLKYENK